MQKIIYISVHYKFIPVNSFPGVYDITNARGFGVTEREVLMSASKGVAQIVKEDQRQASQEEEEEEE